MDVRKGLILEVDGREFVVAGIVFEDELSYLYLKSVDFEKTGEICFVLYGDEKTTRVTDESTILRLKRCVYEREKSCKMARIQV